MITALNMTMPIKQDAETQQELKKLKAIFADHVQPKIDEALKKSELVHFARVLVIDDKYIQVITEFDGDKENYTEFFRTELNEVFKAIFALVDGVPSWDELNDKNEFYRASKDFNVKALGKNNDDDDQGYLFCAFDKSVKELKDIIDK